MGRALAGGWFKAGLSVEGFIGIDPGYKHGSIQNIPDHCIKAHSHDVAAMAKVLVIALKPQLMKTALPSLQHLVGIDTLLVSVAAGTRIKTFTDVFGTCATVRAMPNTPAAVGASITGMVANTHVGKQERALAETLLACVGQTVWVSSEHLLDSVTAVSGSGPAYVFYLVEAMAAAAVNQGLDQNTAMTLARETIIGAGRLLQLNPDISPHIMRENVTSPNGTTAAALNVLMEADGLGLLMDEAIAAAVKRARELS